MRTTFNISWMVLAVLFSTFSSCLKKGDEDPLISLRTRNNRLIGKWKLVNKSSETIIYDKQDNGDVYNEIMLENFDGEILVEQEERNRTGNNPTSFKNSNTYNYELTVEINKDGSVLFNSIKTQTSPISKPSEVITTRSTWHWLDSKQKRTSLQMVYISGEVIRLTNKELIIESDYSNKQKNTWDGTRVEYSYDEKVRYEFKKE